jgi:hypothetical protein
MRRAWGWWSAGALALGTLLSATRVGAQEPAPSACSSERFIVLTGEGVASALFNEVHTDLAAELAHRGMDVCPPEATSREPAAIARVSSAEDGGVVIELDDRVTHKRVGRDLPLARVPLNGRALAIAIAIDELLRASWAELTLRGDEPRANDAEAEPPADPDRTRRTVNARGAYTPPPPVKWLALGGELGYLHGDDSFDAFSLGARLTLYPWQRGWFAVGLSGLASLPANSPLGDVLAAGLRGTLTAGACARDRRRIFACGGARAELDYLSLRGIAPEMARAHVRHAGVVQLGAVGLLGIPLAETRTLFMELAAGGAVLGAEATDGARTILGVTGLMLGVNLGLEFEL